MSQSITIKEGGQAKAFGRVQRLEVANSGGGTSLWVPEDEVDTKSLHVDKNGKYIAETGAFITYKTVTQIINGKPYKRRVATTKIDPDRICYGYDEVSVNITNYVAGIKDDKPISVGVDDDGFLTEEELPTSIEITVPADRLIFIDGEDIDTTGMEVTGYYQNGSIYGVVSDWTIDPTVADISKSDYDYVIPDYKDTGTCKISTFISPWSALQAAFGYPHREVRNLDVLYDAVKEYNCPCFVYVTNSQNNFEGWSPISFYLFPQLEVGDVIDLSLPQQPTVLIECYGAGEHGGVAQAGEPLYIQQVRIDTVTAVRPFVGTYDSGYGYGRYLSSIEATQGDGTQDIKVMWTRDDGEVLETEYKVKVIQNPIGEVTIPEL